MRANIIDITPKPANATGQLTPLPTPEVSWHRARQLWQQATRGADALIELCHVLLALREQFYNPGGETKYGSSASGRADEKGWQAKVRHELGISHQTALRLMQKGEYLLRIKGIAEGEDVEYEDARGEIKVVPATPERQTLAREVMGEVVAGTLAAPRAWAGICGEGSRVEMGRRRADVDYAAVMLRAIRSVKSAIRRWPELGPEDRADVEVAWCDLLEHVPDTWLPATRRKGRK